ncbi:unnamed protein product [Phytomonas sp. Hart1]|nr:unnamed protein product [Phytomonas sp. Hart1]|eukprot:CCW65973.1 unnamed protein product [Phytomonas sp. isolate Hart1]
MHIGTKSLADIYIYIYILIAHCFCLSCEGIALEGERVNNIILYLPINEGDIFHSCFVSKLYFFWLNLIYYIDFHR